MTIGICARGPNAGLAVFTALRKVEHVAWGSIGGFAVYAVIDAEGRLHRIETPRGGSTTLLIEGERTGVEPQGAIAEAPIAALISSGPDRPAPLAGFLCGAAGAGLVSGHRLPNALSKNGRPLNEEALAALREGLSARDAVDRVLDANPEADAGLIAVDLSGGLYARSTARVARRPDLGQARRESGGSRAAVEVLHNSILPGPSVAALAAEVALQTMVPSRRPDGWVTVEAGTPVEAGAEAAVLVDDDMVVRKVVTTDRTLLCGRCHGAAIYLGTVIRQGDRIVGRTSLEPNVVVEDGRIRSMSGQTRLRLEYQRS